MIFKLHVKCCHIGESKNAFCSLGECHFNSYFLNVEIKELLLYHRYLIISIRKLMPFCKSNFLSSYLRHKILNFKEMWY